MDPERTAKEHYGLSCKKLAQIELNGALYSSVRQDFSHAAGLSCEPALSDSQSVYAEANHAICGRGNFILRLSHQKHRKALSEPQRQHIRHAVFSLACEGVAGTQQSTSIDGSLPSCTVQMLERNWEVVIDQGPTARQHKTRSNNFD